MSSPAASPAASPAVRVRSRVPRLTGAAAGRARLAVVPRPHTRAPRMPFVALVSLLLLGGVVGLLLFNTSMQQSAFAATALEGQARTMAAREQTLQMELEALRNPQAVAQSAQRLGMVPACQPAFLSLGDGEVLGRPCAATAAGGLRLLPRPPARPPVLDPAPVVVPAADAGRGAGPGGAAAGSDGRGTDDRRRR